MTLRILYDNAADTATLTASTEAGSLVVENLLTDIKSEVWRATATTAAIEAEWTDPVMCRMAAIPFCNLTSTATIRVRGYTNAADVSPAVDTGTILACAYDPLGSWFGTRPLGVNAFSYGGGTYARAYFAATWVRKLVIDIVDDDNTSGYVEASRLVAGDYWSPQYNASQGAELLPADDSKHDRSDSGDLRTKRGPQYRVLNISLDAMFTADRARLYEILRGNGLYRPLFISLFPGNESDPLLEQAHQLYCKLSSKSAIALPLFSIYAAPLEFEEI